jgi:hypothetical protein
MLYNNDVDDATSLLWNHRRPSFETGGQFEAGTDTWSDLLVWLFRRHLKMIQSTLPASLG